MKALAAIFAIAENGVIGRAGQLPWDFPEDRAHFAKTTMGHAVIMGRRTFEERGALEGRTNIVVSRSTDVKTLDEALRVAWEIDDEPFVIGGVRIFEEAMPRVTRVFITDIPGSYEGDAVLRFDRRPFRVVSSCIGEHGLRFSVLERDAAPAFPRSGALLSKSRFVAGMQCPKLLYWRTHEPEAPELVPGASLQAILDQGKVVGERARELFPGGELVPEDENRVAATRAGIDASERSEREVTSEAGATTLFEASFLQDDVFVAVDVLVREPDGTWTLIEVKSTTAVTPQHIDDVAVQTHVVERAGLSIGRTEIMHLDPESRTTRLEGIFKRVDVTNEIVERRKTLEADLHRQLDVVRGGLPIVEVGPHCFTPYRCPFRGRCWPPRTERNEIFEVDEGGLRSAMSGWLSPIAFLDFETMAPAFPIWEGYAPYEIAPLQLSAHVEANGDHVHHAWMVEGGEDPRRPFAEALLKACAGAHTILAYNASYERNIILRLAEVLPDLAPRLRDLAYRTCDMLAPVRNHVTHPEFEGSYSLKRVLPVLTGLGYDDLEIDNGLIASRALQAIVRGEADPKDQRDALLAYCARDTWGLVLLLKRLRKLVHV